MKTNEISELIDRLNDLPYVVSELIHSTVKDTIEALNELLEENLKLIGKLPTMGGDRDVKRYRIFFDTMDGTEHLERSDEGNYVKWEDYEWMANYADQLVAFTNMPCLPADLRNLRQANADLANENAQLQNQLNSIPNT